MADWELVDISPDRPETKVSDPSNPNIGGLQSQVENLHRDFWQNANHLAEVEERHKQVLVSSGMIPESHLAATEPSRKLNWFVEELNGRVNPDGLSIPLKGLEIDDISIQKKTEDNETAIKFIFTEKDGSELERVVSINHDDFGAEFSANFFNNWLHIRW